MRQIDPQLLMSDPTAAQAAVRLRYLGTAGFVFEGVQRTIVVDPFVSRPGLLRTGFCRLRPDLARIKTLIPQADDVLIGHAHHDHIMDAPALCHQTGARLIGSPSACNVGRAAGLPESQLLATQGREDIPCGRARVRGLPSRHGKVYFNRVPLPGLIPKPPPWPPRFFHLRHGLVLNWLIEIGGVRIIHIDSADYIEQELDGIQADVLCMCAIGWRGRPGYVEEALTRLQPKLVVACHWDLFFQPFEAHPRLLPGLDLDGFLERIRSGGATPWVLPFNGLLGLDGARPGGGDDS